MEDFVILVDQADRQVGIMKKLEAHVEGLLHRAFSVFIFNSEGKILLQKRHSEKYHSGGLWSNTCCSHPKPGEDTAQAAKRRLYEEMGMKSDLVPAFSFVYKSNLDNNLTEFEYDHVFYGYSNHLPEINVTEVEDYRYVSPENLKKEIEASPDSYTEWLKICLDNLITHLTKTKNYEKES